MVKTGYDNVLLVRLVLEMRMPFIRKSLGDALQLELAGVAIPPDRIFGLGIGLMLSMFLLLEEIFLWLHWLVLLTMLLVVAPTKRNFSLILIITCSPKAEVLKQL